MPEKPKTRDWKDLHYSLAAFAMMIMIALWNVFAIHDRGRSHKNPSALQNDKQTSLAEACISISHTDNLGTRCSIVTSTRSS